MVQVLDKDNTTRVEHLKGNHTTEEDLADYIGYMLSNRLQNRLRENTNIWKWKSLKRMNLASGCSCC